MSNEAKFGYLVGIIVILGAILAYQNLDSIKVFGGSAAQASTSSEEPKIEAPKSLERQAAEINKYYNRLASDAGWGEPNEKVDRLIRQHVGPEVVELDRQRQLKLNKDEDKSSEKTLSSPPPAEPKEDNSSTEAKPEPKKEPKPAPKKRLSYSSVEETEASLKAMSKDVKSMTLSIGEIGKGVARNGEGIKKNEEGIKKVDGRLINVEARLSAVEGHIKKVGFMVVKDVTFENGTHEKASKMLPSVKVAQIKKQDGKFYYLDDDGNTYRGYPSADYFNDSSSVVEVEGLTTLNGTSATYRATHPVEQVFRDGHRRDRIDIIYIVDNGRITTVHSGHCNYNRH